MGKIGHQRASGFGSHKQAKKKEGAAAGVRLYGSSRPVQGAVKTAAEFNEDEGRLAKLRSVRKQAAKC